MKNFVIYTDVTTIISIFGNHEKFNINHKKMLFEIMLFEVRTQSQQNKIKFSLYVNVICSNSIEILPTQQFETVDSEGVDLHKNTGQKFH